jgi:hypothetical protein
MNIPLSFLHYISKRQQLARTDFIANKCDVKLCRSHETRSHCGFAGKIPAQKKGSVNLIRIIIQKPAEDQAKFSSTAAQKTGSFFLSSQNPP